MAASWNPSFRRSCRPVLHACVAFLACAVLLGDATPAHSSKTLIVGWDQQPPYSFTPPNARHQDETLEGIDIDLIEQMAANAGRDLIYRYIHEQDSSEMLESGEIDMMIGASVAANDHGVAYHSKPYRTRKDVLFVRPDNPVSPESGSVVALLDTLDQLQMKVGRIGGRSHDAVLGGWLEDPVRADRIYNAQDAHELVHLLDSKLVDVIILDHLEGLYIALEKTQSHQLRPLAPAAGLMPVRLLFSRDTTNPDTVAAFDTAIGALDQSGHYHRAFNTTVEPLILRTALAAPWFRAIEVIGTFAFALSGLLIARREGYHLFGALLLAFLAATGGGIIRDLLLGVPIYVVSTPLYLVIVVVTVIGGYALIRGYESIRRFQNRPKLSERRARIVGKVYDNLYAVTDALGLGAFSVYGIAAAVNAGIENLWLWGPFFAALTGSGGGILRDIVRAERNNPLLKKEFYAEISIIWGAGLSFYLQSRAGGMLEPGHLESAVIITMLGIFLTRTTIIAWRLKNAFSLAPAHTPRSQRPASS